MLSKVANYVFDDSFSLLNWSVPVRAMRVPAPFQHLLLVILRQKRHFLYDLACVWIIEFDTLET